MNRTFILRGEHLKLLQAAYVSKNGDAPSICPKKPYGDSDFYGTIAKILGEEPRPEEDYEDGVIERYDKLHEETKTALQICLRTQSFKPGIYSCPQYTTDWERLSP